MQDLKLFQKEKPNRVRFRAMMESGLLIDEESVIVQTQVIANNARASIRNRDTVPLSHLIEEDRVPVWRENLIVETGLSPPPGMDSRYILEDSHNLHTGIRSGAVDLEGDSPLKSNSFAIMVNVAAVIIFLMCGWLSGLNIQPDAPIADAAVTAKQAEERVTHGSTDAISNEATEAAGKEAKEEGAGEGPRDTGESSEESVLPGSGRAVVDPVATPP